MTKSEQVTINRISAQMRKACLGFIGDPITSDGLERMRLAINEALCRFAPYNDVGDYIKVKCDAQDGNKVIIAPKKNAPLWVVELFCMIGERVK